MSLLSLTALARLAERNVRAARRPLPPVVLIEQLTREHGVNAERAADAVRLGVDHGRLVATPEGLAVASFDQQLTLLNRIPDEAA